MKFVELSSSEFEKASKAVYNFFLQLLEEGKFTDSLGREYDLEKLLEC